MKHIVRLILVTFISFLALQTTLCLPKKLIEHIYIQKNRLEVTVTHDFKKRFLKDDFFVEYDDTIDLEKIDYAIALMPFVMNIISLIWISGEEYTIECMDEEVYHSLERIKEVFRVLYPQTPWTGTLVPQRLVKTKEVEPNENEITALLFSGGLDSTASSLARRQEQQLLITAWGQSALPLDNPDLWYKIKKHIVGFAQQFGHKNTFIKSNYYYFLNLKKLTQLSPEIVTWRIGTIEDIGWAGLCAPILLTHGIKTLRIASSDCWDFPYPSAANPFIDGNLTFAGLTVKHDQFDLSRFDKTLMITKLCRHRLICPQKLIICQKKGGIINCSRCEKCLITIISLMAAGVNPQEYGFAYYSDIKKNMRALVKEGHVSGSGLWQLQDVQKKLLTIDSQLFDLNWFLELDLSQLRPYDVKKATRPVDWSLLKNMFPFIAHTKKEEQ